MDLAILAGATSRDQVMRLQAEVAKLPQYEPETRHYFHAGMYVRETWRAANVIVVGAVHKKEHFYLIVHGTVLITQDAEPAREVTGPALLKCEPGTKRAVVSLTPALCMTFHVTDAKTVDDAEAELVEADPSSMYLVGNKAKREVLS